MREGTYPVALLEPAPTGERDAFGDVRVGPPIVHRTLAAKKDAGGPEGEIAAGVRGGEWRTEFVLRSESVGSRPTENWTVLDDAGARYDVEAVVEVNSGPHARWLKLVCVRHRSEP